MAVGVYATAREWHRPDNIDSGGPAVPPLTHVQTCVGSEQLAERRHVAHRERIFGVRSNAQPCPQGTEDGYLCCGILFVSGTIVDFLLR